MNKFSQRETPQEVSKQKRFIIKSGAGWVYGATPVAVPVMTSSYKEAYHFTLMDALEALLKMREVGIHGSIEMTPKNEES